MAGAIVAWRQTALEAAYRKQFVPHSGIPDNNCRPAMLSRTF
jgi:hypothetical protein